MKTSKTKRGARPASEARQGGGLKTSKTKSPLIELVEPHALSAGLKTSKTKRRLIASIYLVITWLLGLKTSKTKSVYF